MMNPSITITVYHDLSRKAINPITKTNWEGLGVVPDIPTSLEDTLEKSHELARVAATKHGIDRKQLHEDLSVKLVAILVPLIPKAAKRPFMRP